MAEGSAEAFMQLTGADRATAERVMAAALSDLEAAIALYYDDSSPADEKEEGEEKEEEAEAALPSGDVVSHILNNAKEGEDAERWAGPGRTLSGDSSASPPTDSRQNAKRVRIIFWADGFTVEDLSREEAEEEAPAAPRARKTGIQTLGDHRAAESRMPQMKVPELRKYEDNHQFMEDLKKGLPPSEFREIDLSSGIPVRYGLRLGPCVCPLYTILSLCGTAGYSLPLLADIHPCPSLSCIA